MMDAVIGSASVTDRHAHRRTSFAQRRKVKKRRKEEFEFLCVFLCAFAPLREKPFTSIALSAEVAVLLHVQHSTNPTLRGSLQSLADSRDQRATPARRPYAVRRVSQPFLKHYSLPH